MENCKHENRLKEIESKINKMKDVLYGNGREGLLVTTTKLSDAVNTLSDTNKTLTTAVHGLTRFKDETIGETRQKTANRQNMRWVIGILVTMVVGLGTALIITG